MLDKKTLIDEGRLYRRIPVLKRLVPSASKRIARLLWPNGRVLPVHHVRLVGLATPVIYIFGDSHCGLFAKTPGATMHYLGPITMHRVGRDGLRAFASVLSAEAMHLLFCLVKLTCACTSQSNATTSAGRRPR
jgi:hypothetical protein